MSAPLPEKSDVCLALLQSSNSIYIHLDPRKPDVIVPSWLRDQPQLVLQVGLNMAVAIPDLDVGKEALSCTLSFNRRGEYCYLPWESIYGIVGEDGRGMIWPDSVPPEVAAAAEGRPQKPARPALRLAAEEGEIVEDESPTMSAASDKSDAAPAQESDEKSEEDREEPALALAVERVATSELASEATKDAAAATGEDESAEPAGSTDSDESASVDEAAKPSEPADEKRGRKLPPYLRVVK